jgi:cyclase
MLRTRVIPCLLLSERRLIKTTRFKKRVYVGDPINTIKIFNDKEVDELVLLDIDATVQGREPDYQYLELVAMQCFMPLAYGGGITTAAQVRRLLNLGIEKVVINAAATEHPDLIRAAAEQAGSQSIVVSIDAKTTWFGKYEVRTRNGRRSTGHEPATFARSMQDHGAGEILLNSIDRDGTMTGYDLDLTSRVSKAVSIPMVVCGGAGKVEHFTQAVAAGASAVAAGSMFVFTGPHKAVLINFPSRALLEGALP